MEQETFEMQNIHFRDGMNYQKKHDDTIITNLQAALDKSLVNAETFKDATKYYSEEQLLAIIQKVAMHIGDSDLYEGNRINAINWWRKNKNNYPPPFLKINK